MNDLQLIRLVTYNCFGWNNGKECCLDLLSSKNVDFLLIQEHWLFEQQFCQLMINNDYLFTAICGMDSDTPLMVGLMAAVVFFTKRVQLDASRSVLLGRSVSMLLLFSWQTDNCCLLLMFTFLQMMEQFLAKSISMTLQGKLKGCWPHSSLIICLLLSDFNTDISRKTTFSKTLLFFFFFFFL